MVAREACPAWASPQFKNNGHLHHGKQNHRYEHCGRQLVLHASHRVIAESQCTLVERLLRENISLHGLGRAIGVSIRRLMDFMVACVNAVPKHL